MIDQVELQWRMRTDAINIRLGLAGAGKTAPASVAALAIVAEQWRTRRAPIFITLVPTCGSVSRWPGHQPLGGGVWRQW